MALTLLEAGLAKLQTSFGMDRIQDAHLLAQAEQSAKMQKLKVRIRLFHTTAGLLLINDLVNFFCRYGRTLWKGRKFLMVLLLKENIKKS